MNKFLIVAGYGWSGSSALIDLLREYENTVVPDVEFRIIKDPYGIAELMNSLVYQWDYINSSAAIDDFVWLCKKCNRDCKHFYNPFGLSYNSILTNNFLSITHDYINKLTSFNYLGSNYNKEFKKNYFNSSYRRFARSLNSRTGIKLPYKESISYFSKPTKELFLKATQEYLQSLFAEKYDNKIIVLDQAISPLHFDQLQFFGEDCKMIIVDRNPWDIYIDMINNKSLIGSDLVNTHDVSKYYIWHESIRPETYEHNKVLLVSFEKLVREYETEKERIEGFISWDLGKQVSKQLYFKPSESKKNIDINPNNICSPEEISSIKKYFSSGDNNE